MRRQQEPRDEFITRYADALKETKHPTFADIEEAMVAAAGGRKNIRLTRTSLPSCVRKWMRELP